MTLERVWFATLIAAMLIAGSTLWTNDAVVTQIPSWTNSEPFAGHAGPSGPSIVHEDIPTTAVIDSPTRTLPAEDDDWLEPRVDLNGNEIDAAVSDYRVDARGELYERHAPDTALLHLSSPKL